ncbi:MAG: rod shape-determining protein MreD [Clostridia bacterium]|nr:rod shape-determining protein MreD [Clostridia bacterium]
MNISSSKEIHIRRILFVLVAAVTAVMQHTPGFSFSLGNIAPMLLIPFVVCVAMYERTLTGLVFGVIAGAFWDFASAGADGMFTLLLSVIGFFTGVIITFYIRNRLVSAVFLTFISSLAVSAVYWAVFVLRKGYDGSFSILLTRFIPVAVYSTLFVFVYYYLIGFIIKITGKSDKARQTYIR